MEDNRIKDSTAFLMIFIALCLDGIQALIGWIPIFGNILSALLSIFIFMTFLLWFKMHGIKMLTPKRFGAMALGGLVEILPYINLLPAWTAVVVYLIGSTKIKELTEKHPMLAKTAMTVGGKIKKYE